MNIHLYDDETIVLRAFSNAIESRPHTLTTATTPAQVERQIHSGKAEAIVLDLDLQGNLGFSLLEKTVSRYPDIPIVVLCAENSVKLAVEAMRRGACDYVVKPLEPEKLESILERLESLSQPEGAAPLPNAVDGASDEMVSFETEEPAVAKVYEMALKAARTEANVVLLGPSGTGKTVLARHIHRNSGRREHPFVVVHCPSLSAALLESELFGHVKGAFTGAVRDTWGQVARAHKGTLFLDEIGDLPAEIQAKLLRLLQEGEYERVGEAATHQADVRIIAATNANLEALLETGEFREDLYYRLNVVTLTQLPLAERPRDLVDVAERYLRVLAKQLGTPPRPLSKEALAVLQRYPWPGNFRELRNVIERALIFCEGETITLDALPRSLRETQETHVKPGQPVSLQILEEEHIRLTMDREETMKDAADVLGIDTTTLYRKRKKMGDELEEPASEAPELPVD